MWKSGFFLRFDFWFFLWGRWGRGVLSERIVGEVGQWRGDVGRWRRGG